MCVQSKWRQDAHTDCHACQRTKLHRHTLHYNDARSHLPILAKLPSNLTVARKKKFLNVAVGLRLVNTAILVAVLSQLELLQTCKRY